MLPGQHLAVAAAVAAVATAVAAVVTTVVAAVAAGRIWSILRTSLTCHACLKSLLRHSGSDLSLNCLTFAVATAAVAAVVVAAAVAGSTSRAGMDFDSILGVRPLSVGLDCCRAAEGWAAEPFVGWVVASE